MMHTSNQPKPYSLALADGTRWAIQAGDAQASCVVDRLGGAMQLQVGHVSVRPLMVVIHQQRQPAVDYAQGRCALPAATDGDGLFVQLLYLSLAIARDVQARGGILLHGGLAEYQGRGVILAAPGGTGKTTASLRLPPPWHSLCDDTALVVRDAEGAYQAHPWPTWSRFLYGGQGGSWNVQQAVPLHGVFFLSRATEDSLVATGMGQAAGLLVESAEQASHPMGRHLGADEARGLRVQRFENACTLSKAVPAYLLRLTMSGRFWNEIERVLFADKGGCRDTS